MASVERRGDSYRITVSCGYSADGSRQIKQSTTWKPSKPNLTPKQLEKQLQAAVAEFERRCKSEGTIVASVKFEPFAESYLADVASRTLKPSTLAYYEQLKPRIYAQIGHLRLDRVTPREIDKLIAFLCKERKAQKNCWRLQGRFSKSDTKTRIFTKAACTRRWHEPANVERFWKRQADFMDNSRKNRRTARMRR